MQKKGDSLFRKNDLILITAFLIAAICIFFITKSPLSGGIQGGDGGGNDPMLRAVISIDGEDILSVALSDDSEYVRDSLEFMSGSSDTKLTDEECSDTGFSFTLSGSLGSNSFLVSEGGIRCISADCPDKVCMNEGLISYDTETIVCLPHRLIVRVEPD